MFYTEYFTLFPQFLQISIADNVLNVVPSFEPHNYNRFFERYHNFFKLPKANKSTIFGRPKTFYEHNSYHKK